LLCGDRHSRIEHGKLLGCIQVLIPGARVELGGIELTGKFECRVQTDEVGVMLN
jgi:hypothetical protein